MSNLILILAIFFLGAIFGLIIGFIYGRKPKPMEGSATTCSTGDLKDLPDDEFTSAIRAIIITANETEAQFYKDCSGSGYESLMQGYEDLAEDYRESLPNKNLRLVK